MAGMETAKVYKEEVTKNGAMKIEVVLEEAKKKKRPSSARTRPGSATSVRSMEDIEKLQQVRKIQLQFLPSSTQTSTSTPT